MRFEAATDVEVKEKLEADYAHRGFDSSSGEHSRVCGRRLKKRATMGKDEIVLVNMSGRGDKDIFTIADALDDAKWKAFIEGKADQYRRERE